MNPTARKRERDRRASVSETATGDLAEQQARLVTRLLRDVPSDLLTTALTNTIVEAARALKIAEPEWITTGRDEERQPFEASLARFFREVPRTFSLRASAPHDDATPAKPMPRIDYEAFLNERADRYTEQELVNFQPMTGFRDEADRQNYIRINRESHIERERTYLAVWQFMADAFADALADENKSDELRAGIEWEIGWTLNDPPDIWQDLLLLRLMYPYLRFKRLDAYFAERGKCGECGARMECPNCDADESDEKGGAA